MEEHDRQRLAAILGMLGSAHAGERAAAALQAERFRKQHGLSWEEVLRVQAAPVVEVSEPEPPPAKDTMPDIVLHPNMSTRCVVTVALSLAIFLIIATWRY